jgi:hypothetical protein
MFNLASTRILIVPTVLVAASMGCGSTEALEASPVESAAQGLALGSVSIWTPPDDFSNKATIPVCFMPAVSDADRQTIREGAESSWEAIDEYLDNTLYGVDFVGWETCPSDPTGRFVSIDNQVPGATSGARMGKGGMNVVPTMKLASSDFANGRTIPHEFGHVLGFSHEYTRPDYGTPPCSGSDTSPAKVGLTSADRTSIMNYSDCGSADRITLYDMLGFSLVYGPQPVLYSSGFDNSSGFYALHDGSNFIDASGSPSVLSDASLFLIVPADYTSAAQPVFHSDTFWMFTKGGSYVGEFLVLGRTPVPQVMVQEIVELRKVSGPDETNLPNELRIVGMGVEPALF